MLSSGAHGCSRWAETIAVLEVLGTKAYQHTERDARINAEGLVLLKDALQRAGGARWGILGSGREQG